MGKGKQRRYESLSKGIMWICEKLKRDIGLFAEEEIFWVNNL